MEIWRLANPDQFTEPALIVQHSHWLCALAVFLAILAASVFLPVKNRFHRSRGSTRYFWWLGGSFALGTGVWAMHFTAMLAFSLPVPIRYDIGITIVSMIPAIVAAGLIIQLSIPTVRFWRRLHLMAFVMAAGVGSMHYIGMEAMIVPATMYYAPMFFLLSIVAAYVFALLGLYTYTRLIESKKIPRLLGRTCGSVLLGFAISATHFTAMSATYFQPRFDGVLTDFSMPPLNLVIGLAAITILLLGMTAISSLVDRRMEAMSNSLARSELLFGRLAETTHVAIFTLKGEFITYANPALSEIIGYDQATLTQRPLNEIFSQEFSDFAELVRESDTAVDQALYQQLEIESANGQRNWLHFTLTLMEIDEEEVVLGSAFDITEQKNASLSMRRLAFNDQLTKIGNRTMFMDRLEHHMAFLKRRESPYTSCIMLLDLDNFKAINDTYGHMIGDQLLITVAERLSRVARKVDTVARLGGDEFVFLLEELNSSYSSAIVADRVTALLSEPYNLQDREMTVHSSIGVVELDASYESPDQVLHDADIALYRAKRDDTVRWVLFDQALDAKVKRTRRLQIELKRAVAEGSLELYYQPIVASDGYDLKGFEALARWQRDCGEWVSPVEFIPMAEETGLIGDIGIWALETACDQLAVWNAELGDNRLYASVNVAPVSFYDERFSRRVAEMFVQHRLEKGQLKLELTERMLVDDSIGLMKVLNRLIELGCEFMIDDFGTGYSSLAYLHRLPIQTVKIDRTFVSNLDDAESSVPIVETITALARSLKMNVVSEGVENERQAQQLASLGSDQLQGYWFARPMPCEETRDFLQEYSGGKHSIEARGG